MTYDDQRKVIGRTPCIIVELDLDFCSLTYGSAPCVAALGTTGTDRCFNTRKTCQDPANYSPAAKTYRFSNIEVPDPAAMSSGMPCFPYLLGVTTAPTKLDPGNSVGMRASITCTFTDGPYSDRGVDKYVSLRSYDPETRSTFWPKLKARNPFYQYRALRVLTGYLDKGTFNIANFKVRHYIIDSIKGPDSSGNWTVVAKDVLKLADDTVSQAPVPNDGTLVADMGLVDPTFTIQPTGTGDLEYAASGTVYIDKECITFTRVADVFTVVSRGTDGTTSATHSAGATVQQCLRYTEEDPATIVKDLLVTYAGIDPSFIDFTAWTNEVSTWLGGHILTRLIVKPTGVQTLLSELMQQGLITIWWDETTQLIPLIAVRPPYPLDVTALDENYNLVDGSISVSEDVSKRITQVWVFRGRLDLTIDDRDSNYADRYIAADVDAESNSEYGTPSVLKIYAKWLREEDTTQSKLIAFRLLSRYRDPLVTVGFTLDAKDSDLWTGGSATIQCRQIVDEAGVQQPSLFQVLQVQDMADGSVLNYQGLLSNFAGRYAYITANDMVDYGVATAAQRLVNGFITQNDGRMPDLSDGYVQV